MTRAPDAFIAHSQATDWSTLSEAARAAVKTFLLDSIGVGVAGAAAPLAVPIRQVAGLDGGPCTVFGGGAGRAADAAFVNGFQIHCQEFDCVHEPAVVHPMATILATLMATADEMGGVPGPAFGAALSVAVDCAAGLGVAVKSPIRFFRPATAGLFGATLGSAKLRGLDAEQTADALGYALAFCSGTMQAHVEGKPALPVQIANAAGGAVRACALGALGMAGPRDVFEGPFGYLSLFEEDWDLTPVLDDLGRIERITEVSHKPFPTGRAAQGGIVLMARLREMGVEPGVCRSITLHAPPLIKRLVGRPVRAVMDANYARLCFQYSGAVALRNGTVGLDDFSDAALRDPDVLAFAPKIRVVDNDVQDPAAFTPQVAVAELEDGQTLTAETNALFGSPADPLSPAQNEEKFRACVAARFPGARGEEIAGALIDGVAALERLDDVSALSRLAAGLEGAGG